MSAELITPRDLLRKVGTRQFDYSRALRAEAEKRVGPVSCTEGCAWCCYSKIMIDAGTGGILAVALEQEGRWTPELRQKLAAADSAMSRATHHDWFETRTPCVFLDETSPGHGSCTVYRYRPFSCVATFSVSDPARCSVGGETSQFQLADENLTANLLTWHEAILNGAGETQLLLMTIPGAVLYGHAMLAGEPRPDVHRVAREDCPVQGDPAALVAWLDETVAR